MKNVITRIGFLGWIIIFIVVVVIIVLIYIAGKAAGKSLEYDPNLANMPGAEDFKSKVTEAEYQKILDYVKRLYKDMKGPALDHDNKLYNSILSESDRIIQKTYLLYNIAMKKIGEEDSGTLRDWIDNENIDSDTKKALIKKFDNLKLK